MRNPVPLVELWRGDILESVHSGHAVICDAGGEVVEFWGNPDQVIYPRSSVKILQALPLVESGAADGAGLTDRQLALACASHHGAAIHTDLIKEWLADLGMTDGDLRCGVQVPRDPDARKAIICADISPCQYHNNCSGKHSGFLTLGRHLGAGTEYIAPDHPVQLAAKEAFEDMTGEDSPAVGIDGCSAPNFATTVAALARAMARVAAAREDDAQVRRASAARLAGAMHSHPELVAGTEGACTLLMQACIGRTVVKTGAEGVYAGILPEQRLGIALKIADGATRASECAISALLVKLGVLNARHPVARRHLDAPILNRRDIVTGFMRVAPGFA